MTFQSTETAGGSRFVRRTSLAPHEYRKNFHQIDGEVITALASPEADRVTPLMSKIYLRLVSAPTECWEGPGTLYFTSKMTDGKQLKASKVLYEVLGVASATAHKALSWMHEQGIIGYSSGKNGVGIRIFLNRAATSIGLREEQAGKKNLPFARGSNAGCHGSSAEPSFKDSFAVLEILDKDLNPHAPKTGAETFIVDKKSFDSKPEPPSLPRANTAQMGNESAHPHKSLPNEFSLDEIITQLRIVLEPKVAAAAALAAAREHERTREWLDRHGIPKATRVAQREAYNVLRSHGMITGKEGRMRAELDLGRAPDAAAAAPAVAPHPLTVQEIMETAETCLALLEAQGKSIELTLSEINIERGGWLLPEDTPRVREATRLLLLEAQAERSVSDALSC
jgi:hypothetical protein